MAGYAPGKLEQMLAAPLPQLSRKLVAVARAKGDASVCGLVAALAERNAAPTPATHAILTQLKAGECIRRSI